MSQQDIERLITHELEEDPEKKKQFAEKSAAEEIRQMTVTRIKEGIKETMPKIFEAIKASREKPFTKADLEALAQEASQKAGLESEEAVRMPEMLAKAMMLEARQEGMDPEMLKTVREVAEDTLLPDELIQTSTEELLEGMRSSDKELWPSFVNAHVKAISKDRKVTEEAARKKLTKALAEETKKRREELNDQEIEKQMRNAG